MFFKSVTASTVQFSCYNPSTLEAFLHFAGLAPVKKLHNIFNTVVNKTKHCFTKCLPYHEKIVSDSQSLREAGRWTIKLISRTVDICFCQWDEINDMRQISSTIEDHFQALLKTDFSKIQSNNMGLVFFEGTKIKTENLLFENYRSSRNTSAVKISKRGLFSSH